MSPSGLSGHEKEMVFQFDTNRFLELQNIRLIFMFTNPNHLALDCVDCLIGSTKLSTPSVLFTKKSANGFSE